MGYIGKRRFAFGGGSSSSALTNLINSPHFADLGVHPISGTVGNITFSSSLETEGSIRTDPETFATMTINAGIVVGTSNSGGPSGIGWFWVDKLVMNGSNATLDATGTVGGNGVSTTGGSGGAGSGGGGGGGGSVVSGASYGRGGPNLFCSDSAGEDGFGDGGSGIGGVGGIGYAEKNDISGYNQLGTPYHFLVGGAGGGNDGCTQGVGRAGAAGGGVGGDSFAGGPSSGGGGGGGGRPLIVSCREFVGTGSAGSNIFKAKGGNGGSGNSANDGSGGGGGMIQFFICKVSTASLATLSFNLGGGTGFNTGDAGNYEIYEISKLGVVLNTFTNTIPAIGWNHT